MGPLDALFRYYNVCTFDTFILSVPIIFTSQVKIVIPCLLWGGHILKHGTGSLGGGLSFVSFKI